ncbi:MAG: class I SAM-dependent methyltransferase [Alphaproteobacteria bacterium]|nr:class I SAM-dependent methyltransferase [Alphaproteobacteria bacterium]
MENTATALIANSMDQHYRYQRLVYDKTRQYFLIGRQHLIDELKPLAGQSVLEIGCGTAWNLIKVANRHPEADVFGIDLSRTMLQTASQSLRRKGLQQRIVLSQGDATSFDARATFGRDYFDRIFFSYSLSMIPDWSRSFEHALDMLASGGTLHVVDFGQCEELSNVFKRSLFAFLAHYKVTPRGDLPELAASIAKQKGFATKARNLHYGYTSYISVTAPGNCIPETRLP